MLALVFSVVFNAYANPIIRADGRAISRVSEHIALHDAKSRLWDNARQECSSLGYDARPSLVPNSGHCSAYYSNRLWTAECYSNFRCEYLEEEGANDYGPWPSENGNREFFFRPGKTSWWKGDASCQEIGASLPSRRELERNFVYLNGTTPLGRYLSHQEGVSTTFYPNANIWTRDVEPNHQAWAFNPTPSSGAITYPMDMRLNVVCIR